MAGQWLATCSESYRKDVCGLLGVEVEPGHSGRTDHATALARWIDEDPGIRTAQAGKAIALLLAEEQLAGEYPYWTAPEVVRHFAYLTAGGYRPTAAEQTALEGDVPPLPT